MRSQELRERAGLWFPQRSDLAWPGRTGAQPALRITVNQHLYWTVLLAPALPGLVTPVSAALAQSV